MKLAAAGLFGLVLASTAQAQIRQPQPSPAPPPLPAARDVPFAGVIGLQVDATDLDRRIFRVHETVPVRGGEHMILLYPKWLPGNHSPTGPIDKLGGLVIHAAGRAVEWVRDPVDVYAFHVDVPAGASTLELDFQYLSPVAANQGRVVMTPEMLNLQWNTVALYPAGYFARQISFAPSVRLPKGWQFGTALQVAGAAGGATSFKPVSFNTLVDSPMFAGRYFRRLELDPGAAAPVRMNIVADEPGQLEIKPEQLAAHKSLVQQAYRVFGSHHYDHYDFLVALSDHMSGIGLEHHRSSEDGTVPTYFTEWDKTIPARDLLPHEFTHSWDGKFRRPADLWTPEFNTPMRDSLLWVYEGQTQYWGNVLSARSGLWTRQQALDAIAADAATYDHRVGRSWRALEDTTNDPIIAQRRPLPWRSWQRSEDYYVEGELVWLDADTLIRERSGGRRSLDDFAKAFFGIENGSYVTVTYTFEDVVRTLNGVLPYDWARFLRDRLYGHGPGAPLDGLRRGGYRLVYTEVPSEFTKSYEAQRKVTDLTYSLGLVVDKTANLTDVLWDGPAFRAGLTSGVQIVAVNGVAYEADRLKDAVRASKGGSGGLELLVKNGDRYRTVRIDYHDGLRYPHLERDAAAPARLDAILTARP